MSRRIKYEVKVLTYHELGVKLDDQLDSAKAELAQFEGAKMAFNVGKTKVEDLTAHVDKDIQENLMDLTQATLAKKWILMAIQAEVQGYQAQGKVMALTRAVTDTKLLHDLEKVKLDAAIAAESAEASDVIDLDPNRPVARPLGEHPGNPLADRRGEESPDPEVKKKNRKPRG
jgi:hypothetical protein